MQRWPTIFAVVLLTAAAPKPVDDLEARVVDVGNGLCVVVRIPGGHALLYDAGDNGSFCRNAVEELIPGDKIDLVILSHSDADHIGELPAILALKHADTIVFPGDAHIEETETIRRELTAITTAGNAGTRVWSLAADPLPDTDAAGVRSFQLGEASVTLIAGWSNGDMTIGPGEAPLPKPEHNNALSIVARLEYRGRSILLTGDTVGRFRGDANSRCAYAERIMTEAAAAWPIASDVLIGQHHGGDNASSNCFIRAVSPKYVVFSAGNKGYRHPSQAAADRFLAFGVPPVRMFRTDRGDDEGAGEWQYGDVRGCIDQPGDDDIEIRLPSASNTIDIAYRLSAVPCPVHTQEFYVKAKSGAVSARNRRKKFNP